MPKKRSKKSSATKFTIPAPVLIGLGILILLLLSGFIFADRQENRDSFCASCHSEPEATYYQRSIGSAPVDLASRHHDKAVRCIDCHSGSGLTGRFAAMQTGSGDLFAWLTHTAHQPAPLTKPIPDANCLKCHGEVLQRQEFNNHFHVFLPRWQAIDPKAATCVDCHVAHSTDGSAQLAFLNENRTQEVCQRCHAVAGEG